MKSSSMGEFTKYSIDLLHSAFIEEEQEQQLQQAENIKVKRRSYSGNIQDLNKS